jgi:hypothetical protein
LENVTNGKTIRSEIEVLVERGKRLATEIDRDLQNYLEHDHVSEKNGPVFDSQNGVQQRSTENPWAEQS